MTREIKFRAWDKVHKRFMYLTMHPTSIGWSSPEWMEQAPLMNGDSIEGFGFAIDGWQQFTGLHDKNGKEIYEGDIVTDGSLAGFGANIRYQATIEFKDGCWKQTNSNCDCGECTDAVLFENHKELEVIGNIHENKELLKKETGL